MSMGPLSAAIHLFNLVLPALAVAVLLVLGCKVFMRKRAAARGTLAQIAINFVVGGAIIAAGLVWLGRDGKMLTYAALVLGCATTQWVLLRGWR
ncbi:hypothetical protein QE399_000235 [Paracidovorax wautersii]|uniref:3TM holin, Phage_holin_3 n=2 Tax=Paracidovorax wautersii TaxID=1177982 RepID=A0ABU1I5P9_9BURK|nr:hypothetical protein [Paracidovorax wautersii]